MKVWRYRMGIAMALLLFLAACSSTSHTTAPSNGSTSSTPGSNTATTLSKTPFVVYLDTALSGTGASVNQAEDTGLQVSAQQINSTGGVDGHPMQIVIENDQGSADTAVTLFDSYLASHSAPGVVVTGIGNLTTEAALLPIAAAHGLLTFNQAATATMTVAKYPLNFEANVPSDDALKIMAQAVQQSGYKNVAVMVGNDAFGQNELSILQSLLKAENITVTATAQYDDSALDFTSYLAKLQTSNPSAVLVNMYGTDMFNILKDKVAMGWNAPLIGDQACGNTFTSGVIPAADSVNAQCVAPSINVGYPASQQTAAYKAAYAYFGHYLASHTTVTQPLELYSTWWDIGQVIRLAANQAGSIAPKDIATALTQLHVPSSAPLVTYMLNQYSFSPSGHIYGYGGLQLVSLNQLGTLTSQVEASINAMK